MNNDDIERLSYIKRFADLFRDSQLSLEVIVSKIEALILQLGPIDGNTKKRLWRLWGELEDSLAVALDRQQEMPSYSTDVLIQNSIDAMIKLISEVARE